MDEVHTAVIDHTTHLSAAEDAITELCQECSFLRSKVNDLSPDYTAEVMDQQHGLRDVMATLREKKIKHSLQFPAKLHVHHNALRKVFASPGDAPTYIGTLQQDTGND